MYDKIIQGHLCEGDSPRILGSIFGSFVKCFLGFVEVGISWVFNDFQLNWAEIHQNLTTFPKIGNETTTPGRGSAPGAPPKAALGYLLIKILKKRSLCPPQGHWKLFQKCFKIVAKMSHPLFLWSCPFPEFSNSGI